MEEETVRKTKNKEDNLIPFKKGESGNPNGRPKGQRNYATIYREALVKITETKGMTSDELEVYLEEVGINKALKGEYQFFKDIRDRIHGSATNKTDITSDGEKIQTGVVILPAKENGTED